MTHPRDSVIGPNCSISSKCSGSGKGPGPLSLFLEEVRGDLCVSDDDLFTKKWWLRSRALAPRLFGGVLSCGGNRRVSILGVRGCQSI